jgi:hypothetical protein
MNIRNTLIPLFFISLTILANQNAIAGKVYQWTDEEGIVHFSDIPPEDTTTIQTREINIDIYDDSNVDPEMYSIINQLDRMAERRRQVTEERLARKRLQLEEKRLAQVISRQNVTISAPRYVPYTYSYVYPQPYIYYQRRHFYNQPGYHPYPTSKAYKGRFSLDHQRTNTHHYSKIGIRF